MTTQTTQPTEKAEAQEQPIVHTPGPWTTCGPAQFADKQTGTMIYAEGGNGHLVATVRNEYSPNQPANARLIAAAPDLLAACKSFLDIWHRAGPLGSHQFEKFDGVVRRCSVAVDNATGEVV